MRARRALRCATTARADDRLAAGHRPDQQRRQAAQQVRALQRRCRPSTSARCSSSGVSPSSSSASSGRNRSSPGLSRMPLPERVDHRHRAPAQHLDQSDHAQAGIGAQVQRIGVGGVHPAQHHVDPLEGAQRPHPQLAVAHHQVGALHQRETQHAGQIGLVERGLGVDAGAEHHHHRLLRGLRGGVDQRQPQRLRPRRGRPGPDPLVQVGEWRAPRTRRSASA